MFFLQWNACCHLLMVFVPLHKSLISLYLANQINFEVNVIVSLWLVYCGGDEKCGHQPCDY